MPPLLPVSVQFIGLEAVDTLLLTAGMDEQRCESLEQLQTRLRPHLRFATPIVARMLLLLHKQRARTGVGGWEGHQGFDFVF